MTEITSSEPTVEDASPAVRARAAEVLDLLDEGRL